MKVVKLALAAMALQSYLCWAGPVQKPLELSVFPGGFNWPIWVAQERGNFARQGVAVNVTPTPSSVVQMTNLIEGRAEIAMTAIDNVVAYREGQGEVPLAGNDLVAIMGGDRGFLKLVSAPDVKSIGQLRGKTVSVDARNTGYAFVLLDLLKRGGLSEPDFNIERAGGVLQRFQALQEKRQAGTLLISPFDLQAQAAGFHVLATAAEFLGAYQGQVAAVRKSWADENKARLSGYIRAYVESVEWLYDPANKEEALRIYRANTPASAHGMAEAVYAELLDPVTGFQRKAKIDLQGVTEVLKLRERWATPAKRMGGPEIYYDGSYYDAALMSSAP